MSRKLKIEIFIQECENMKNEQNFQNSKTAIAGIKNNYGIGSLLEALKEELKK